MAKNVQGVIFLRNGNLFETREAALAVLTGSSSTLLTRLNDGEMALARYGNGNDVKTLAGIMYKSGENKSITVIDVEGASADVEELRREINAKLGTSFISSGNTVEANLTALSGNSATDTSATTSVEGAKRYAEDLVGTLDGGVTAETGYFVKSVSEVDGKISGTTEALPSYDDTAVAKKFVIAVDETNGQIAVERGEISSSAETIVLTDNTDGGVNFEVNIDNATIVQDETTKKLKVASAALTQYIGDENTIEVSAVDPTDNTKTISSLLTITKVTTGLSEEVKEEYHLVGSNGNTIGEPVKIYKDSHIVSIEYIDDPADPNYQKLEYVYVNASGVTSTTYVDMSELVLEAEFASGLTISDHVARGVVDPNTEVDGNGDAFLTVGADGFKVDGIKDEIDKKLGDVVAGLDATVTGETANQHVSISIEELDGKLVQSGLTITETDIASAADLAELSGKTVTAITSNNGSITASIDDAAGCKTYDLATDASKIKMSGFTSQGVLSGISTDESIVDAFGEVEDVIEAEIVRATGAEEALDGRLDAIESGYVETVKVNNVALTETDNAVNVSISASNAAPTGGINDPAIVVTTDQSTGAVTLGIGYIDCGTYDEQENP